MNPVNHAPDRDVRVYLVTCRNNHVYDAAQNPDCPICRNKAEQQRKYDGQNTQRAPSSLRPHNVVTRRDGGAVDLDKTMNLFDDGLIRQIYGRRPETSRKDVSTSQRGSQSVSGRSASNHRRLTGWLVCLNGKDYGMSLQLLEGQNFISFDENGYLRITREPEARLYCFACISVTPDNRFYLAPFRNSTILADGRRVSASQEVREHQILKYRNCEVMFIPFTGVHYNWS